jgi:DNA-binding response OmpR family regulator
MSNIQTIMLVEDDDKLASLLHDYLSNFGFDVVVVHSGIDAVEKNTFYSALTGCA